MSCPRLLATRSTRPRSREKKKKLVRQLFLWSLPPPLLQLIFLPPPHSLLCLIQSLLPSRHNSLTPWTKLLDPLSQSSLTPKTLSLMIHRHLCAACEKLKSPSTRLHHSNSQRIPSPTWSSPSPKDALCFRNVLMIRMTSGLL